ncbi:MAG: hypothetical protein F6K42_38065 [Leptolyngbya sp. SIO1D8]|nr:hypothetical protein [Leptolyngbya sp. SIO1D8]
MPVFYSLKDIATIQPWQVGETARLLHQLQQAGHTIPKSWIISDEIFQKVRQQLVAREPAFADWPQLLWQTPNITGYARQNLAKRLIYPLVGLHLNLPLQQLLDSTNTPVHELAISSIM